MTEAAHRTPIPWTEDEYLDREERSEDKHELIDGQIYAMAGSSPEHSALTASIIAALHTLAQTLPRPGTLLAAGGETLRGLCLSLGASSLEVHGRIVPGLPRSILRGGRWDEASR